MVFMMFNIKSKFVLNDEMWRYQTMFKIISPKEKFKLGAEKTRTSKKIKVRIGCHGARSERHC